MHISTKMLTRAAAIAALYTVLTLILQPISFGPLQLRVSEALTLLPCLWPEAIGGLFIGCFLSNMVGGYGILDAVVGSLATLLAAVCTYRLRKNRWLAALPPVLINAVAIGLLLYFITEEPLSLPLTMLQIGLGQAIACYVLGIPMLRGLEKSGLAQRL